MKWWHFLFRAEMVLFVAALGIAGFGAALSDRKVTSLETLTASRAEAAPACVDECSTQGEKFCIDSDRYRECNTGLPWFDADSCLEYTDFSCSASFGPEFTCRSGFCVGPDGEPAPPVPEPSCLEPPGPKVQGESCGGGESGPPHVLGPSFCEASCIGCQQQCEDLFGVGAAYLWDSITGECGCEPAIQSTPPPPGGGGGGNCTAPSDSPCAADNLRPAWGGLAESASQICMAESGGNVFARNFACLSGGTADYSIGLFQINLLAWCPDAFAQTGSPCKLRTDPAGRAILAGCMKKFGYRDADANAKEAYNIYLLQGWCAWTNSANKCGVASC